MRADIDFFFSISALKLFHPSDCNLTILFCQFNLCNAFFVMQIEFQHLISCIHLYEIVFTTLEPSCFPPIFPFCFSVLRGTLFVLIILSRHITKPTFLLSSITCWNLLSGSHQDSLYDAVKTTRPKLALSYCSNYNLLIITKRVLCVWRSVPPFLRFWDSHSCALELPLSSACF